MKVEFRCNICEELVELDKDNKPTSSYGGRYELFISPFNTVYHRCAMDRYEKYYAKHSPEQLCNVLSVLKTLLELIKHPKPNSVSPRICSDSVQEKIDIIERLLIGKRGT